jgi:uncharacterized protein YegL
LILKDVPQDRKKQSEAVDLIFVLDVSGSMAGERLNTVKEAVQAIISISKEETRLAIVSFHNSSIVELPLTKVTNYSLCGMSKSLQMNEQGMALAKERTKNLQVYIKIYCTDDSGTRSYKYGKRDHQCSHTVEG